MAGKSGPKAASKKREEAKDEHVEENREKAVKKKDEKAAKEKKAAKSVKGGAVDGVSADELDNGEMPDAHATKAKQLVRSVSSESLDPLAEPEKATNAKVNASSATTRWRTRAGHSVGGREGSEDELAILDPVADIANMLSNVDINGEAKGRQKKLDKVERVSDEGGDTEEAKDEKKGKKQRGKTVQNKEEPKADKAVKRAGRKKGAKKDVDEDGSE
ncbi:hypothetical protein PT974_01165 [Cladobotryum mycophilum]|uniref:Uncharacterized protein n=1 Tax=Cladobotryum mycophilum TaxID=491253 RepID=A0ABR0T359_9HYPO